MRGYYKIGILFFMLFSLVIVSTIRWYQSYDYREKLSVINQQIEQIRSLDSDLLIDVGEAHAIVNNDAIVRDLKQYQERMNVLKNDIKSLNDLKIKTAFLDVEKVVNHQNAKIEEYKSKHAILNNSLAYLITISDDILYGRSDIKYDDSLSKILQKTLFGYYKGTLPKVKIPKTKQTDSQYFLWLHIGVLHRTYEEVRRLENEFRKHTAHHYLDDFDDMLHQKLSIAKHLENRLFIILFVSALVFLVAGLVANILQIKAKNMSIVALSDMKQFAKALDASAIVSKTNPKGVITYVNENFCQISGYSEAELIGKTHKIVRHPDMDKAIFKKMWTTILDKQVFKATLKNRAKDGSSYYVDSVLMPLLDVSGEIREFIAVRYDVSELVRTRDKAVAAQIAKDEFFSNMSHELRTPLNAIIGFSQLLSQKLRDEKEKKQALSILSSGTHLLYLINDILDLSKMESGKFSLEPHAFNCDKALHLLMNDYVENIKSKELDFELRDENLNHVLFGDWLRISQIITNLLGNAIKFTPQHGRVSLGVKYDEKGLLIQVTDSGIGMEKEVMKRIFNSFEQADNSTTREYGGTGLGLSISKQLVDLMHGNFKVESTKGVGSYFEVFLPLEIDKSSNDKDEVKVEVYEPGTTQFEGAVLVAEDNKTNQLLIMMMLEEYALSCDIANDGLEAVIMCQDKTYDLILMDENMPTMNGITAMHKIHEMGVKTPIVALTANAMKGDKERFIDAGMDGYIPKPIESDVLQDVLQRYLKKIKVSD